MKSRDWGFLLLGAVISLLGFSLIRIVFSGPERGPEIGGQEVPKQSFIIDFSRRYHITLSDYRSTRTYSNAKIMGYTGETNRDASGGLSKDYRHFGQWLVIELPDRRRVYFPPTSIAHLEEVEPISSQ